VVPIRWVPRFPKGDHRELRATQPPKRPAGSVPEPRVNKRAALRQLPTRPSPCWPYFEEKNGCPAILLCRSLIPTRRILIRHRRDLTRKFPVKVMFNLSPISLT